MLILNIEVKKLKLFIEIYLSDCVNIMDIDTEDYCYWGGGIYTMAHPPYKLRRYYIFPISI